MHAALPAQAGFKLRSMQRHWKASYLPAELGAAGPMPFSRYILSATRAGYARRAWLERSLERSLGKHGREPKKRAERARQRSLREAAAAQCRLRE